MKEIVLTIAFYVLLALILSAAVTCFVSGFLSAFDYPQFWGV